MSKEKVVIPVALSPCGCGYRKGGGLYFRSDGAAVDCGKLPIPLTVCPHCSAGIKFSRSPQWIMGSLLTDAKCKNDNCTCPIGRIYPGERYLLRVASRMILQVTKIGIERLEEITSEEIFREGIRVSDAAGHIGYLENPKAYLSTFQALWNKLHKKTGWEKDKKKFVWVINYKIIKK